jgi:putative drug exporter of the RND superfamily
VVALPRGRGSVLLRLGYGAVGYVAVAHGADRSPLRVALHAIMNLVHWRHFWLAGLVLAFVLALLPFSFHAERHLETATRVEGSEAHIVTDELATRFRSPFVDRVVLVIQGLPPADSQEGQQALATIVERNRACPEWSPVLI